jgi:hypothetical protein
MNAPKRLLWIVLGVVVGLVLGAIPSLRAEQPNEQPPNTVAFQPVKDGYGLFFMTDDRTHSCWVGFRESGTNTITALSQAPKEACR